MDEIILNKPLALQLARTYILDKYAKNNDKSNLHYVVVGKDPQKGVYAEEHVFCANDKESDKITLNEGEYLIKVYRDSQQLRLLRSQ